MNTNWGLVIALGMASFAIFLSFVLTRVDARCCISCKSQGYLRGQIVNDVCYCLVENGAGD
jgi:hypothetical protein